LNYKINHLPTDLITLATITLEQLTNPLKFAENNVSGYPVPHSQHNHFLENQQFV
jgi:hypothetical protein